MTARIQVHALPIPLVGSYASVTGKRLLASWAGRPGLPLRYRLAVGLACADVRYRYMVSNPAAGGDVRIFVWPHVATPSRSIGRTPVGGGIIPLPGLHADEAGDLGSAVYEGETLVTELDCFVKLGTVPDGLSLWPNFRRDDGTAYEEAVDSWLCASLLIAPPSGMDALPGDFDEGCVRLEWFDR